MSASVLPAVASVHLHSLKPNSFGVADREWAHGFLGLYIPEPNEHEEAA